MKKIKFLAPILAFAVFSCDNYLDINDNPNQVLYSDLAPAELLSAAQTNTFRTQSTTMNQLGSVFSNGWAGNTSQISGVFSREFNLDVNSSFYNGIWDGLYRNIANFQNIIDYSNPSGQYDYYVAISKILKAHYMQYVVDLYGNAPYSEAFKRSLNTTPKYDDDQQIYRDLISELEAARNLIDNAPANVELVDAVDVMLAGDMAEWKAFANTIELRMLLRMSGSTGAVATYRNTKLASIVGGPFISDDVTINPGYNFTTNDSANPFYSVFGYNTGPAATQNLNGIAASGHFYRSVSVSTSTTTGYSGSTFIEMKHNSGNYYTVQYPNVADPRKTRIFRNGASQSVFRGVDQGITTTNVYPSTAVTGLPGRNGFGTLDPYNATFIANGNYYIDTLAEADGFVMTYSEANFLLAEAAARGEAGEAGYAGFSGAQSYFEAGVQSSFDFRAASGYATYIAAINTKPNFGYTGTFDQKLHAIMYQKWIALLGVHGIESFIDYNRTGYPLTPLAATAINPNKPKRLIYPVSEFVANSANVPNITSADIYAVNSYSPFWLQGNPTLGN